MGASLACPPPSAPPSKNTTDTGRDGDGTDRRDCKHKSYVHTLSVSHRMNSSTFVQLRIYVHSRGSYDYISIHSLELREK